MNRFNIEIYTNNALVRVIPNLTKKKVDSYTKVLYVHNGFYKVVQIKK